MHILVKKGLDIPIKGKPSGLLQLDLKPKTIALEVSHFETISFRVLVKEGDHVLIGSPLAENKAVPGMHFASPACGKVVEIRRGLKRRLLCIVIEVAEDERFEEYGALEEETRESLVKHLLKGGIFPHIRMRPFDLVADPFKVPRDIFVKAIESLPFTPPAEMQLQGFEKEFEAGLQALRKLTTGEVHVVSRTEGVPKISGISFHTASGPHPVSNPSLHIQEIAPIRGLEDVVWTLDVPGVITVGKMVLHGCYHTTRVIALAGEGFQSPGYVQGRTGLPIQALIESKKEGPSRIISGDPLVGCEVTSNEYLGFFDTVCALIPEKQERERFHFLGFGRNKYSASAAYFTRKRHDHQFTTNQHGEERAFVDGAIYQKVMPLQIPVMHLVKAILADDYELAVQLGLLEVSSEDFALPTFIDPSKIEMVEIVKRALQKWGTEA